MMGSLKNNQIVQQLKPLARSTGDFESSKYCKLGTCFLTALVLRISDHITTSYLFYHIGLYVIQEDLLHYNMAYSCYLIVYLYMQMVNMAAVNTSVGSQHQMEILTE